MTGLKQKISQNTLLSLFGSNFIAVSQVFLEKYDLQIETNEGRERKIKQNRFCLKQVSPLIQFNCHSALRTNVI